MHLKCITTMKLLESSIDCFRFHISNFSFTSPYVLMDFCLKNKNMNIEDIIKKIVQCAYNVRMKLSAGFLESVYLNALLIELHDNDLKADKEVPIIVHYKNHIVGEFRADIIVENSVVIELKAIQHLTPAHEAQLVNYLTATDIEHGVLINFGSKKIEIKRKFRTFKNTKQ